MRPDREIDAAAGAKKLLGDLRAGRAGADHQHRARRQLIGIFVLAGVDLKNAAAVIQQGRDRRALIRSGCHDDILGLDRAIGGFGNEAGCAVTASQPCHGNAATDRRRDEIGIGVDIFQDIA